MPDRVLDVLQQHGYFKGLVLIQSASGSGAPPWMDKSVTAVYGTDSVLRQNYDKFPPGHQL
jgi:hypothetical protein